MTRLRVIWSDGRVEDFHLHNGDTITVTQDLNMPAFKGKIHICVIEVVK